MIIDDQWFCDYCGEGNQTSLHLKSRGDWRFRKSGLFAKDNNQEGAIPVLLTLWTLQREIDPADFIYSTALKLNGKDLDCEIDLFVLNERRQEKIELGIGECKSDGGSITKDDCDKMKKVANKLKSIQNNVEVYLIFSKTSDNFLVEEIKLLKETSKDFSVIILTNKELEPYYAYWPENGNKENDVPEQNPMDLLGLSRNSKARYLQNGSE